MYHNSVLIFIPNYFNQNLFSSVIIWEFKLPAVSKKLKIKKLWWFLEQCSYQCNHICKIIIACFLYNCESEEQLFISYPAKLHPNCWFSQSRIWLRTQTINTLPAGLTKCKTDSDCEPNKFCRFNKESRGPKSMEETLQASTNDLDTSN